MVRSYRRVFEVERRVSGSASTSSWPSAGADCGATGTYAILRSVDSARVRERQLGEIEAADPT